MEALHDGRRAARSVLIASSNLRRRTKTGVVRHVPVHPVLAAMLAEWKLTGWPALMGRRPEPDDLILPTSAARRVKLGEQRRKDTWGPATRLCAEVMKLRITRERGKVIALPLAKTASTTTSLLHRTTNHRKSR